MKRNWILLVILILNLEIYSQVIGAWTLNGTTVSTYTTDAVGVGTNTPGAWEEIDYCSNSQKGLIVTKQNCTGNGMPIGIPGFLGGHLPDIYTPNGGVVWTDENYYSHIPVLFNYSSVLANPSSIYTSGGLSSMGLYSVQQPLIWAKVVEPLLPGSPISTKFIVTPDGRVGINMPSPRAPLDVRGSMDVNVPIAIFGINTQNSFTKNIQLVSNTGNGGYNNIAQTGDLGIFFTDGQGTQNNGSNLNSSFVIAPWSNVSGVGGLRMESNGNTELRGNLRCTKLTVNAQWWPDFVFSDSYNLLSLDSIKRFIFQNGHLPGFQSQDSIIAYGQDLGLLQQIQQIKIEELTLYLIQQEEKIKKQEAAIKEQEARLLILEKKLASTKD